MENPISYKNRLIRGDSFQLPQCTSWIPRYTVVREEKERQLNSSLTHYDRLDKVFMTKNEADEFALTDAFAPPGLRPDRHRVIGFPRSVNNLG